MNVSALPKFIVLITLMFALFDLKVSSLYSYDGYGIAIIAMTELNVSALPKFIVLIILLLALFELDVSRLYYIVFVT